MLQISPYTNRINPYTLYPAGQRNIRKSQNISFLGNAELKSVDEIAKNHPYPVKAVFSDIDGTLIYRNDSGERELPEENKQAVQGLIDKKIPIILISSRPYKELKDIAKKLEIPNAYSISDNGAVVANPEGLKFVNNPLTPQDTRLITDTYKYHKSQNCGEGSHLFLKINGETVSETQPPKNIKGVKVLHKSFQAAFERDLTPTAISIVQEDPEKLEKLIDEFKKMYWDKYNIYKTSDRRFDISTKNASKSNAMTILCGNLGIHPKNTAAIGDGQNDSDMLELARKEGGLAIAMANADELKQFAEYETSDVKEAGFSRAMEAIIQNNSRLAR